MLFGFFNNLASFENYNSNILTKKLNSYIIEYIKDISIYTKNLGQSHINKVQ